MKPARDWLEVLADVTPDPEVQRIEGRGGRPTLKVGNVFLHSQYNPEQEAARLVDSAKLRPERPVMVAGLGLGYHVRELLRRGFEIAVLEPDPGVAKLALQEFLGEESFLLGVGNLDAIAETPEFVQFAEKTPQLLVHPATARVRPGYAEEAAARVAKAALGERRLSVAVVGPLYGGSLPIAKYLADAFRTLGHQTLYVDNSAAWELYQRTTESVETAKASSQLGEMLTNFLSEWSYARVAEFNPEICIVIAQAPVRNTFPARLAKLGIITAFWYVENWRHLPYWKSIAAHYNFFFHIQPGEFERKLDEIGCRNHAFIQTGCDPNVHKPVEVDPEERAGYECDLSFAGAGYYNRLLLFRGLGDYNFKIWGLGWQVRDLANLVVGGERRFSSETFMKIVAGSRINLNLHSSTAHPGVDPDGDAINPRVFEIAAAGGFQLCDPCKGLESLFDCDTELPVYRDLKELRAKIDYFLAHEDERIAIAERARQRALKEHTYEQRAQRMLDLILQRHGARILRHGVRVQRTVAEVAERVGKDTELGQWLDTLPPDLIFTQDNLLPFLRASTAKFPYPGRLFTYMAEVKDFAETLLKRRE